MDWSKRVVEKIVSETTIWRWVQASLDRTVSAGAQMQFAQPGAVVRCQPTATISPVGDSAKADLTVLSDGYTATARIDVLALWAEAGRLADRFPPDDGGAVAKGEPLFWTQMLTDDEACDMFVSTQGAAFSALLLFEVGDLANAAGLRCHVAEPELVEWAVWAAERREDAERWN